MNSSRDTAVRPFTAALRDVRDRKRLTYAELADLSGARSQAWFHKQLNRPTLVNAPPTEDEAISGLGLLIGESEETVRALIAQEWLGVGAQSLPSRAEELGKSLTLLTREDFELVRTLVNRLEPTIDQISDDSFWQ